MPSNFEYANNPLRFSETMHANKIMYTDTLAA